MIRPLSGFVYLHKVPATGVVGQPSATYAVVNDPSGALSPGEFVLADTVNFDVRYLRVSGTQLVVLPSAAILAVYE